MSTHMSPLPLTVARCVGHDLVDLRTQKHYLDSRCDGRQRLLQATADVRQWHLDGCPRIQGGPPALPGLWTKAPVQDEWIDGVCPMRHIEENL